MRWLKRLKLRKVRGTPGHSAKERWRRFWNIQWVRIFDQIDLNQRDGRATTNCQTANRWSAGQKIGEKRSITVSLCYRKPLMLKRIARYLASGRWRTANPQIRYSRNCVRWWWTRVRRRNLVWFATKLDRITSWGQQAIDFGGSVMTVTCISLSVPRLIWIKPCS